MDWISRGGFGVGRVRESGGGIPPGLLVCERGIGSNFWVGVGYFLQGVIIGNRVVSRKMVVGVGTIIGLLIVKIVNGLQGTLVRVVWNNK